MNTKIKKNIVFTLFLLTGLYLIYLISYSYYYKKEYKLLNQMTTLSLDTYLNVEINPFYKNTKEDILLNKKIKFENKEFDIFYNKEKRIYTINDLNFKDICNKKFYIENKKNSLKEVFTNLFEIECNENKTIFKMDTLVLIDFNFPLNSNRIKLPY